MKAEDHEEFNFEQQSLPGWLRYIVAVSQIPRTHIKARWSGPPICNFRRQRKGISQVSCLAKLTIPLSLEFNGENQPQWIRSRASWGSLWVSTLVPYMQVHTCTCMYSHTYLNMHTHMHLHPSHPCRKKILFLMEVFDKLWNQVGSEPLGQIFKICLQRPVWLQIQHGDSLHEKECFIKQTFSYT